MERAVEWAAQAGFVVLSARTTQAESVLAHAPVAQLFGAIDPAVLAALPDVQRLAADRVLLRGEPVGPPPDERVTAAALLTAVHAVSAQAPVLVAVDDIQWLAPSSLAVLAFVARRLTGPVGVLVTERVGPAEAGSAVSWLQVGPAGALTRTRVAPMSLGALHAMLSTRLGRAFSRPTVIRIAEVSGGNPLYALELARAVDSGPVPANRLLATLSELVRLRVAGLDPDVRDALLEVAEMDGIVAIEGNRMRFMHPLLASGISDNADPARRREVHRNLARIETQPERRARHLALASATADDATLQALDAARARGAPAAAAELVEMAIALGGDKVTRRLRAAEHHFRAGDMRRAADFLEGVIDELRPGVLRALALNLLAGVRIFEDDYVAAVELLQRARGDALGNDVVLAATLLSYAFIEGSFSSVEGQLAAVREAVVVAERTGIPSLRSQALAPWVHVSFEQGLGLDEASLRRAVDLEETDADTPIAFRASATRGERNLDVLVSSRRGRGADRAQRVR